MDRVTADAPDKANCQRSKRRPRDAAPQLNTLASIQVTQSQAENSQPAPP